MSFFSVAIALATDFYTLSLHDALPIFNQFAHIGREVVFRLRRRVGDYREHGEVNVWQVVREPMAPRAHTSCVKGIGSFRCQQDGNPFLAVHGLINRTSAGCPATSKRVGLSNSTSTMWVMFLEGRGLIARIRPCTSRGGREESPTLANWPTLSSPIICAPTGTSAIIRSSFASRARIAPPAIRSPRWTGISETTPAVVARTIVASACCLARS